VGDLVEFSAPAGGQFAGVLLSIDADAGLFDFNHPLAGQTLIFEARIIGIL
jgi:FKBP-type peptidyl-prolyl cis-trans isomerase SlpA